MIINEGVCKSMKIVIAPQAFKNCATAGQVARALSCGVQRVLPKADVISIPIADGGDGTLSIILEANHGKKHRTRVQDAFGNKKSVEWGVIDGGWITAIIESSLVCGMGTLAKTDLNPLTASTHGVGQLIHEILDKGHRRIFIGLGGSATNDGGTGLASALGVRFLDARGKELPPGGAALIDLARIDITNVDKRLDETEIVVGCDVTNPLLGPKGASHVFAPQKGATPEMVEKLEVALANYASIVAKDFGTNIAKMLRGGAAGGMASGLSLFCNGHLVSGAAWILEKVGFTDAIKGANLVIISEGCMDSQTADEKGPMVVAKIAKALGIPVVAIVGTVGPGAERLKKHGIGTIFAASPRGALVPDNALTLLEQAAEKAMKTWK